MKYNRQAQANTPIHRVLRQAADRVQHLVDAGLEPTALTMPHFLFLEHLIRVGQGVSLGHVAEALGCGRSNITQLTDRLERLGLIVRQPDPTDRRAIRAVITQEGMSRYPAGVAALTAVEQRLLEGLSPSGARQLMTSLGKLNSAVGSD